MGQVIHGDEDYEMSLGHTEFALKRVLGEMLAIKKTVLAELPSIASDNEPHAKALQEIHKILQAEWLIEMDHWIKSPWQVHKVVLRAIAEAVQEEREACAKEAERPECECTIAPCAHMFHARDAAARIRARK